MIKVQCTRNQSSTLPFTVGVEYDATQIDSQLIRVKGDDGTYLCALYGGHFLDFEIVK